MRFRLYLPYGLKSLTISQIIGLTVLTNWLGYVFVGGIVLALDPPEIPGYAAVGASGGILAALIPGLGWFDVVPVLMVIALAGIWSHVPGGLGVTEAVFLELLGERTPQAGLLAAVLLFRCVYYFAPFLIALCAYAWLEWSNRDDRKASAES